MLKTIRASAAASAGVAAICAPATFSAVAFSALRL
jgi:hypothetical protein